MNFARLHLARLFAGAATTAARAVTRSRGFKEADMWICGYTEGRG